MIHRVWIEESICATHGMCVTECPEVFEIVGTTARVRAEAAAFYISHESRIRMAVRICPVDAIHVDADQWGDKPITTGSDLG
jgi:ferredoxin